MGLRENACILYKNRHSVGEKSLYRNVLMKYTQLLAVISAIFCGVMLRAESNSQEVATAIGLRDVRRDVGVVVRIPIEVFRQICPNERPEDGLAMTEECRAALEMALKLKVAFCKEAQPVLAESIEQSISTVSAAEPSEVIAEAKSAEAENSTDEIK